jgi:hypothetical protein
MKCVALGAAMLAATFMLSTVPTSFSAVAQPVTATAPTPAALPEATIKALQDALNKQGIAVKADGKLNDETRAAIRKYQSQHHLPVTGEPDKATLDKLGISVVSSATPAGQTAQAPTSPGMTGPMMGPQMMQTMPQGMMGSGMMGPGMMGSQMPMAGAMPMQRGMMMCPMMASMMGMRPGMMPMMGSMMGQRQGAIGLGVVTPSRGVSVDDVRDHFDRVLQSQGNPRVKLGEIKDADNDTIVTDIVTAEGSLVDRFNVNRRSGVIQRAQ